MVKHNAKILHPSYCKDTPLLDDSQPSVNNTHVPACYRTNNPEKKKKSDNALSSRDVSTISAEFIFLKGWVLHSLVPLVSVCFEIIYIAVVVI